MSETRSWVIMGKLDSLNKFIGAMNHNRYVGAGIKKRNQKTVLLSLANQDCTPIPEGGKWTFNHHMADKRSDPDNLASVHKFIFDAYQEAGILANDNWAYVTELHDYFYNDAPKGMEYVEVIVEWD